MLFVLALGLLMCLSDFRLGGDSVAVGDPQGVAISAALWVPVENLTRDSQEIRVAEVSMTAFAPPEETEHLPFDRFIHEAAGRYDVDPDLIAAVIMTESQFNPSAVSKKGAKGLMQIMPVTADALDLKDIYSPEENIQAGTRHLSRLLSKLDGDVRLALAAYNAGLQKVMTYQGIPPYRETEAYVGKVMQRYWAIKDKSIFSRHGATYTGPLASGLQVH
jgi:soluble lytic murein transglycosylase-like protein